MESSVFTFQKDDSQYIYHYTKASTAIDHILNSGTLKFSSFAETNDPKESKDWFFIPGSNEGRDLSKYNPDYFSEILTPYFKEATKLLCFSKDGALSGNHLEDTPKRGFCKPRMWAQYGDNHSGVCLIFDFKRFTKLFHEQFSKLTYKFDYVNYQDRLLPDIQMDKAFVINVDHFEKRGAKDYAYDHLIQHQNRLYFEKAKDWENESEFRFIIFECQKELFFSFENSLSGILFGENCSEDDIKKIVNITKSKGLQYQKLKWRNCTPWFEFEREKWL
jgi:hypothetical protein